MVDIKKYIVDGKVKRDRIVADVKRGRLSKKDIQVLDQNKYIRAAYFGENIPKRNDKKEWTNKYLDELSLAAVSEVFNKEYLFLLNEVADYVIEHETKKVKHNKILAACVGGIIIILIIVLGINLLS